MYAVPPSISGIQMWRWRVAERRVGGVSILEENGPYTTQLNGWAKWENIRNGKQSLCPSVVTPTQTAYTSIHLQGFVNIYNVSDFG